MDAVAETLGVGTDELPAAVGVIRDRPRDYQRALRDLRQRLMDLQRDLTGFVAKIPEKEEDEGPFPL